MSAKQSNPISSSAERSFHPSGQPRRPLGRKPPRSTRATELPRRHGRPLRNQKDVLGYSISPAKMLASTPSLSSHPGILRHGPGTSSGTRSTDGLPVGGPAVCDEEVDVLPIRIRDVQVG